MRGLLFAILFCAFSIALAEAVVSLLVRFMLIRPIEHDDAFVMIMLFMLVCYFFVAPKFVKGADHG